MCLEGCVFVHRSRTFTEFWWKVRSTICQLNPRSVRNDVGPIWCQVWRVRLVTELRKVRGFYSFIFLSFLLMSFVFLRFLGAFAKGAYYFCHFRLPIFASVPRDEFLWNFILETFMKTYRQTPTSVKIGPKYRTLCMKTLLRCIVAGDI